MSFDDQDFYNVVQHTRSNKKDGFCTQDKDLTHTFTWGPISHEKYPVVVGEVHDKEGQLLNICLYLEMPDGYVRMAEMSLDAPDEMTLWFDPQDPKWEEKISITQTLQLSPDYKQVLIPA